MYESDYKEGSDNVKVGGFDIHNPVFVITSVLIILFVIWTLIAPDSTKEYMSGAKSWVINVADWVFMAGANILVLFCLALIISPFGKIRLGGDKAKPEFSTFSWFSMLFAAGMGIGLIFWSVAEPVAYYSAWWKTPLDVAANTPEAASMAMAATMFHWGIHPWSMYAVMALALAFFSYNKGLPLTVRSAFYPILKEKTWGWPGHIIDIIAVLATIFGLVTSLGLGAQQAASGLNFLFDVGDSLNVQITLIILITGLAIISVARGLEGGVKVLSNVNMILAGLLLLFVMFVGPTAAIFKTLFSASIDYAANILPLSNWIGRPDEVWYHDWTVFYWAWWISWSPFVGMFIARVSKGRTVRQFLTAVIVIPTVVTLVWMSTFGGSALHQAQNGIGALSKGITDVPLSMFQMLENLPLPEITSFLAIILLVVFFVTSSDSGSLVIDSITAGGKRTSTAGQRIFWAVLEGLLAAVLLYVGGAQALTTLQAGAITTGLPFLLLLIVMCWCIYLGLRSEVKK